MKLQEHWTYCSLYFSKPKKLFLLALQQSATIVNEPSQMKFQNFKANPALKITLFEERQSLNACFVANVHARLLCDVLDWKLINKRANKEDNTQQRELLQHVLPARRDLTQKEECQNYHQFPPAPAAGVRNTADPSRVHCTEFGELVTADDYRRRAYLSPASSPPARRKRESPNRWLRCPWRLIYKWSTLTCVPFEDQDTIRSYDQTTSMKGVSQQLGSSIGALGKNKTTVNN